MYVKKYSKQRLEFYASDGRERLQVVGNRLPCGYSRATVEQEFLRYGHVHLDSQSAWCGSIQM